MTSHAYAVVALVSGAATLGIVARGPLAKWHRKVKRRRGGVYLWRVDHHTNRARRVNGYVGETVSYHFRSRQHLGVSYYGEVGKSRLSSPVKVPSQPWSDLNPRMYKVIPLPWWLCWKWVLRPLETLVILATWPRYNSAKNKWNPLRIEKVTAQIARRQRDQGGARQVVRTWTAHLVRYVLQGIGCLMILIGIGASLWFSR